MKKAFIVILLAAGLFALLQMRSREPSGAGPDPESAVDPDLGTGPAVLGWEYSFVDPESARVDWSIRGRKAVPLNGVDPFESTQTRLIQVDEPTITLYRAQEQASEEVPLEGPVRVKAPEARCRLAADGNTEIDLQRGIRIEGRRMSLVTDRLKAFLGADGQPGHRIETDAPVTFVGRDPVMRLEADGGCTGRTDLQTLRLLPPVRLRAENGGALFKLYRKESGGDDDLGEEVRDLGPVQIDSNRAVLLKRRAGGLGSIEFAPEGGTVRIRTRDLRLRGRTLRLSFGPGAERSAGFEKAILSGNVRGWHGRGAVVRGDRLSWDHASERARLTGRPRLLSLEGGTLLAGEILFWKRENRATLRQGVRAYLRVDPTMEPRELLTGSWRLVGETAEIRFDADHRMKDLEVTRGPEARIRLRDVKGARRATCDRARYVTGSRRLELYGNQKPARLKYDDSRLHAETVIVDDGRGRLSATGSVDAIIGPKFVRTSRPHQPQDRWGGYTWVVRGDTFQLDRANSSRYERLRGRGQPFRVQGEAPDAPSLDLRGTEVNLHLSAGTGRLEGHPARFLRGPHRVSAGRIELRSGDRVRIEDGVRLEYLLEDGSRIRVREPRLHLVLRGTEQRPEGAWIFRPDGRRVTAHLERDGTETTLRARRVFHDRKTGRTLAVGGVQLQHPEAELRCQHLERVLLGDEIRFSATGAVRGNLRTPEGRAFRFRGDRVVATLVPAETSGRPATLLRAHARAWGKTPLMVAEPGDDGLRLRGRSCIWNGEKGEILLLGSPDRLPRVQKKGASIMGRRLRYVRKTGAVHIAGGFRGLFRLPDGRGGVTLRARKGRLIRDPDSGELGSLRAEGDVRLEGEDQSVEADRAVYDPEAGRLHLTGDPVRVRQAGQALVRTRSFELEGVRLGDLDWEK